jgi:uncharacterized metal-binding protein YceD (DUF177 family)
MGKDQQIILNGVLKSKFLPYLCRPLKPSVMANKRGFEIAFVGLKPGVHEFNYEVDDKFFAERGVTEFANCHAVVKLLLDKKSSFMLLKFEIGGKADVTCDRCGNVLGMDIWDEFNMLVKLVDEPDVMNEQEEDPDVFYISRTESHINVTNWIYEFVMLSFPMQKMCSPEEMGGSQCNKEVLEKLKLMENQGRTESNSNQLWKGLEQFKAKVKKK